MKFSKTLKEKQVQEWRKKYMAYEHLKCLISATEVEFRAALRGEVEKVERFYRILEKGAERGLQSVLDLFPEEDFPAIYELADGQAISSFISSHEARPKRVRLERYTKKTLQRTQENSTLEFYVAISKIVKYKEMNLTGFRKILKKYDKRTGASLSGEIMDSIMARPVFSGNKIGEMSEFVKLLHKEITPIRKREKAKKLVAGLTQTDDKGDGKSFFSGVLTAGGCLLLGARMKEDFCMWYAFLLLVNWFFFSFGMLMYICRKSFVNYDLIFELNLRPKLTISKYFLVVTGLLFLHGAAAYLHAPWYMVYTATAALIALPVNLLFKNIRMHLLTLILEVGSCTVLGKVRFKHFFVADHLLSMRGACLFILRVAYPGQTMHSLSFAINSIPVAIRISQCLRRYFDRKKRHPFPHMYNTLKYLVAFSSDLAIMFASSIDMWLVNGLLCASYLFSTIWDIFVDWMLWKRPKVYHEMVYVGVCALNISIRIFSFLYFVIKSLKVFTISEHTATSITFIGCVLELIRRFAWGVIRVEVEHLNNCDQLKAISGPLNDLFYMEND
ncbi:hypothetical protein NEDG_01879 [Nematocida displodere]|uniref:SPX domain-containing protein n=1 Tax=Nematocida displodere TaxID=1805483 RepID=A0A177EGL2_9MICR|nr:hypothetical protein NEDG_01879 [Nematocida displodere]